MPDDRRIIRPADRRPCPKCGSLDIRRLIDLRYAKGDTSGVHRWLSLGWRECRACSYVYEAAVGTVQCWVGITFGIVGTLLLVGMVVLRRADSPLTIALTIAGLLLSWTFAWAFFSAWRRTRSSSRTPTGGTDT